MTARLTSLAAMLGGLPHANGDGRAFPAGQGPLHAPRRRATGQSPPGQGGKETSAGPGREVTEPSSVEGAVPIGEISWRQKAKIAGRVTSVEVQPWQGAQVLSCTLADRSGSMTLVFTRRDVPGRRNRGSVRGRRHGRRARRSPGHAQPAPRGPQAHTPGPHPGLTSAGGLPRRWPPVGRWRRPRALPRRS